jgi:hypothetical protein
MVYLELTFTFLFMTVISLTVYYLVQWRFRTSIVIVEQATEEAVEQVSDKPAVAPWTRTEELKQPWLPLVGADYPGNNVNNNEGYIDSMKSCAARCENTVGCTSAVYNKMTNQCWLKSKLGSPVANANSVLLAPYIQDRNNFEKVNRKDVEGHEIACYASGEDASQCAALCAVHERCKGYSRVEKQSGSSIWSNGGCCIKDSTGPLIDDLATTFYRQH